MKTEEERILEEVARAKGRAHESGLVTNVFKLYFEYLEFGDYVHPCLKVIGKKEYKEGREEVRRIEAQMGGNTLAFVFRHSWFEETEQPSVHGRLSVEACEKTLFELSCYRKFELYTGGNWEPLDLEAFLGNWAAEINTIAREVFAREAQQQAIADHEQRKAWVAEQAKKFGVAPSASSFGQNSVPNVWYKAGKLLRRLLHAFGARH